MQSMTVKEAADAFQVSAQTIRKWIADSTLPHFRKGRIIRVDSAVLETILRGLPQKGNEPKEKK